jgi:SnoaL-like domain
MGEARTADADTADTADTTDIADVVEIEQLLARYAVAMTKDDIDAVVDVFTPDGTYSAFGSTYALADFPALVAAAPKGLFLTGTPALDLDGDSATGEQPLCFVDQTNHHMRIGWYSDTYRRTERGWRLHTRSMTFLRRSGARDAGKAHDPTRPEPTTAGEAG